MTVELIQGLLLAFAIVVILMPPYIRLLRTTGLHEADPDRGSGQPPGQARHADDGRGADHRRRPGALPPAPVAARGRDLRPARRHWPGSACSERSTTSSTPRRARGSAIRQKLLWQVVFAFAAAFLIQRTYGIDQIAVPFLGARSHRPDDLRPVRGVRDHRRQQRGQHHRWPRRAGRRHPGLRLRRVPAGLPAERPGPAEPGVPVRADHRRPARVPVVQRPPGADLHGRLGIAVARGDPGRHRPDHRPDPRPAPDRADLRDRDRLGHHPDRLLQAERRQAHLPDGADSTITSSWRAGTRRRSRSGSGSSGSWPGSSGSRCSSPRSSS